MSGTTVERIISKQPDGYKVSDAFDALGSIVNEIIVEGVESGTNSLDDIRALLEVKDVMARLIADRVQGTYREYFEDVEQN